MCWRTSVPGGPVPGSAIPAATDETTVAGRAQTAGCIAACDSMLVVRSIAEDTACRGAISSGGQQLGLVSPSRLQHALEVAALIAQRPSGHGPTVRPASATMAASTIEIQRLRIAPAVWDAADGESTLATATAGDSAATGMQT